MSFRLKKYYNYQNIKNSYNNYIRLYSQKNDNHMIPRQRDFKLKKAPPKLSIRERIRHEVNYYWNGTKKLYSNIKISRQLIKKHYRNQSLTWREERILKNTTKDVISAVPFAAIAMIPLSEFFLPILIKMAPGLLPSTFQNKQERLQSIKNMWVSRLEIAGVLQKSIQDVMIEKIKSNMNPQKYHVILEKIQKNEYLSNSEIILIGRLIGPLKNDFYFLSYQQLIEIAKFYNLSIKGPKFMIRSRIKSFIIDIQKEDQRININELSQLPIILLIKLNQERGMRIVDRSPQELIIQLKEWLELSNSQQVSPYLLLASRSFNFMSYHIKSDIEEKIEMEKQQDIKGNLDPIKQEEDQINYNLKDNRQINKSSEQETSEKVIAADNLSEQEIKNQDLTINQIKESLDKNEIMNHDLEEELSKESENLKKLNQRNEKLIDRIEKQLEKNQQ